MVLQGQIVFNQVKKTADNSQPLLKIKTAIPLNPFPTEIIIDSFKVDIVYNQFFDTSQVVTFLIKELVDVSVETTPFFGAIRIVAKDYPQQYVVVKYLKKNEANKAKRIIEGLMVLHKNGVDLSKVDARDFLDKIEQIGTP